MIFDRVVRDILDGKLEHDQTAWHCGTAHCVRGWFEVKAAKHFYNQDYNPITETFVNPDGTVHNYSAIFGDFNIRSRSPLEQCSYLTGYDFTTLAYMFDSYNTHTAIKKYAQSLGINLSPTINECVKNVLPQMVRVTSIS